MTTKRVTLHLTEPSLKTLDAGVYPGGGRSQRVNGILERYTLTQAELADEVEDKFAGEIPALASAYFSDGSPGPWIRGWASTQVEIAMEARGTDDWRAVAAESPFIDKLLSASDAELCALEELIAQKYRRMPDAIPECTPETVSCLRVDIGITQEEAAEFAGVSLSTWQAWEKTGKLPLGRWEELVTELTDPQTWHLIARERADRPHHQKPRKR